MRDFYDLERAVPWDMYEIKDRSRFISKCPPGVTVDIDSPIGANNTIRSYSFFSCGETVHMDYSNIQL